MNQDKVQFDCINLHVDGFKNPRKLEGVMPIFYEEQPATWLIFKEWLLEYFANSNPSVLDVGTGSGFWAILLSKYFSTSNILGIDKNLRCIKFAKNNQTLNQANTNFKHQVYNISIVPEQSQDLIVLAPPYHIYPKVLSESIPYFARGGYDGQGEFKSQLTISKYHLRDNGVILFNMMNIGKDNKPFYINHILNEFGKDVSLYYVNIFAPWKTYDFLSSVYGTENISFIQDLDEQGPEIFYTSGIIVKNKKGIIKEISSNIYIDLQDRSWDDRVKLHKEINNFNQYASISAL